MGAGFLSSLKFLPGVGLGGGVQFFIYIFGGGGGPGNLETPLATPLILQLRIHVYCGAVMPQKWIYGEHRAHTPHPHTYRDHVIYRSTNDNIWGRRNII